MHIHATAVTPAGDSLAGFQAAQTANALRRARELSDAAARVKARTQSGSMQEDSASFASLLAASPAAQSQAQAQVAKSVTGREEEASSLAAESQSFSGNKSALAPPPDPDSFPSEKPDFASGNSGAPERSVGAYRTTTSKGLNASATDWLRPVSFWA